MFKTFLKSVFVFSGLFVASQAEASTLEQYREQFENAAVPLTYDLENSKWTCHNVAAYGDNAEFEEYFFHFWVMPHNHRILFNNDSTVASWIPRWFSEYQGLRTSVAFGTNDFIRECPSRMSSCAAEGTAYKNHAYIRYDGLEQKLFLEWTMIGHPELSLNPISPDREVKNRKVFMYSVCRK